MSARHPWPAWTPEIAARVRPVGAVGEHGACACGRRVVARHGYKDCGQVERHARTRCVYRKTRDIVKGGSW